MRYKSVVITQRGGPEVLQIVENDLRPPAAGEAQVKILAVGVCQDDKEDWLKLFALLAAGQIKPIIAARFPILQAGQAGALLESGVVIGNVVLLSPELL